MINTRRIKMNTFNNILFEVLSELIDAIMEKTVLEIPENRCTLEYYPKYLDNIVLDRYWRDPNRDLLRDTLAGIDESVISIAIRNYLKKHDYIGALKYLAKTCGCTTQDINEYAILYQNSFVYENNTELEDSVEDLKKEIEELKKENAQLKAELAKYSKKENTEVFTRENITPNSVQNAKVKIFQKSSGYSNEYENIDTLLETEGLTLDKTVDNGYTGLANILRSKANSINSNAKYVCIGLDGYRIDFYFD